MAGNPGKKARSEPAVGEGASGTPEELARRWTALDVTGESKQAVQTLLKENPGEVSRRLLEKRLLFGTAGLRGAMHPVGLGSMNAVVVYQAAQGLCRFLEEQHGLDTLKQQGVIVGHDARHNSQSFAHITAAVFLSRGAKVVLFREQTPTPLTPFSVVKFKALAGIQVTASHNPKQDNGYKVYASNGAQIVSPMDSQIMECILKEQEPWAFLPFLKDLRIKDPSLVEDRLDEVRDDYVRLVTERLCTRKAENAAAQRKFVYTAMHGVGWDVIHRVYAAFGLTISPVECQRWPDPEFPTVVFPNPEEKGALDAAMRTADELKADVVVANDPDADRLAVAERQADGAWKVFHGDEVGTLLADWALQLKAARGGKPGLVLNSAVSSAMLGALAAKRGCQWHETLTGFKWLANESLRYQREDGVEHLIAYEEALGYMLLAEIPDKCGISAAAVLGEMSTKYAVEGKLLSDRLKELQAECGCFVSHNGYFKGTPDQFQPIFDDIRKDGYPKKVGRFDITRVRDVTLGHDSQGRCELPATPDANMITLYFANGTRLTLRGSGTEPKCKYYAEASGSSVPEARQAARDVVDAFISEVVRPDERGVKHG